MTKELWLSLSEDKKKETFREWLQQIYDIEKGRHRLSGTKEQGKLSQIRKDLEKLILSTLEWERG